MVEDKLIHIAKRTLPSQPTLGKRLNSYWLWSLFLDGSSDVFPAMIRRRRAHWAISGHSCSTLMKIALFNECILLVELDKGLFRDLRKPTQDVLPIAD